MGHQETPDTALEGQPGLLTYKHWEIKGTGGFRIFEVGLSDILWKEDQGKSRGGGEGWAKKGQKGI